jgi:P2-related tail formation protein
VTIPSRVLGSGSSQLSTVSICGDGLDGIVAAGTSAGNATQLTHVFNQVNTAPSGSGVKLPPTEMGEVIYITNSGGHKIFIYPFEAATVINKTTSAECKVDHSIMCWAVTNSVWFTLTGAKI